MKKPVALKIITIAVAAIILAMLVFPSRALAWSGVTGNNTHNAIDEAAYTILSRDPAFRNVNFPSLQSIKDNDYVNPATLAGPGPDVVGQSNASSHYYNPRLTAHQTNAGGGPDAVKDEYIKLVNALSSGNTANAAHTASWVAHYAADINTPYHTQGTYRSDIMKIYNAAGGQNAAAVPLPSYIYGTLGLSSTIFSHPNDFKDEIEEFIAGTAGHTATEDWFDPWYWDGSIHAKITSSHVVYEGGTFSMPGSWLDLGGTGTAQSYSSMWANSEPCFCDPAQQQAAQIVDFARDMAEITQRVVDDVDGGVTATIYLKSAIESAATVWRASFSGLSSSLTFSVPDKDEPQKFKVEGMVSNIAGANVHDVQLKITLTGGSLVNGEEMPSIGYIESGSQKTYTWEVEANQIGYCTAKMEVIGKYYDTPDLQYAVTQETVPGILPVSASPTNEYWNNSVVFCLDNSGSMQGQPIIDAMNAGVRAVTAMPSGPVEMALYFFGTSGCAPPVRVVDFTVNRDRITAAMKTASAKGDTPLAAMITTAGDYIKSSARGKQATIILLTDGKETCSGNPVEAARALNPGLKLRSSLFAQPVYAANDIPIKLQVIGFNIKSSDTENMLREIAEAGNGNYYPATGVDELVDALTAAVKDAAGTGFEFQYWWLAAGGAVILFVIILLTRRGKRSSVPITAAAANTGFPKMASTQTTQNTAVNALPSTTFCQNCGFQITGDAAYCAGCGKPVTPPAPPSPAFCSQCGTAVTAGSLFCSKCGSSLKINMPFAAAGSTQYSSQQKPAGKTSAAWWLLPVFLTWIGGLVAFLVVKDSDKSKAVKLLWTGIGITLFWIVLGVISMVMSFLMSEL